MQHSRLKDNFALSSFSITKKLIDWVEQVSLCGWILNAQINILQNISKILVLLRARNRHFLLILARFSPTSSWAGWAAGKAAPPSTLRQLEHCHKTLCHEGIMRIMTDQAGPPGSGERLTLLPGVKSPPPHTCWLLCRVINTMKTIIAFCLQLNNTFYKEVTIEIQKSKYFNKFK